MKILVNNQTEANLVETFLMALREEMLDSIQTIDHANASTSGFYLSSEDYEFLEDGVYHAEIVINDTVREMSIEPYNITGVCVKCGIVTDGTIDGNLITYQEFLDMLTTASQESWLCESCWYKRLEED